MVREIILHGKSFGRLGIHLVNSVLDLSRFCGIVVESRHVFCCADLQLLLRSNDIPKRNVFTG